jgi:hypothetical protein
VPARPHLASSPRIPTARPLASPRLLSPRASASPPPPRARPHLLRLCPHLLCLASSPLLSSPHTSPHLLRLASSPLPARHRISSALPCGASSSTRAPTTGVALAAHGAQGGRPLLPSPPRPRRSAAGMALVRRGGGTSDSGRHHPPLPSVSPSSTRSARWRAAKQGWRSWRRPAARAARCAPSPSTAARRARTRAPWPMGGTGSTTGKWPMCRVMG